MQFVVPLTVLTTYVQRLVRDTVNYPSPEKSTNCHNDQAINNGLSMCTFYEQEGQ